MAEHRFFGWRRQAYDPRDRTLDLPNHRRLSGSKDLSAGMGPQLNQGAEGSCGPNTFDEIITFLQRLQGLPTVGAARLFVYYQTRVLMGTVDQDSGVDNRTLWKAAAEFGFPGEDMEPYDDSFASMIKPPSPELVAAAALNRITDYAAVVQSIGQMQGVIDTVNRPFMFGFDVFQQIMSEQAALTGVLADPPYRATPIGGHDVTICGYNGTSAPMRGVLSQNKWPPNTFKFRNHWMNDPLTPWGDGGYGYVTFAYALSPHAADFWMAKSVPGGVTPPAPTPSPSLKTFSFPYDPAAGTAGPVTIR